MPPDNGAAGHAGVSISGDDSEKLIREKALLRLSGIFGIPAADLDPGRRFGGDDLKASFVSDFRRNELDRVSDDILDVADRAIAKEISSGHLTVRTVGEYCDLMVRCSRIKRKNVLKLLEIDENPGPKTGVIDLPSRRHLAVGLRHLAIGRITNEDFERCYARSAIRSKDPGVRHIYEAAWQSLQRFGNLSPHRRSSP